jgi:hypothetical protein
MTDNKEQRLFLKYKYRFMRWKSHYFVYSMIYDYDYIEHRTVQRPRAVGFPTGFSSYGTRQGEQRQSVDTRRRSGDHFFLYV